VRLADEPEGGVIGPASFLPAAERYGLIRAIDRMVLEKVVTLLADSPGSIAMNLSALSAPTRECSARSSACSLCTASIRAAS